MRRDSPTLIGGIVGEFDLPNSQFYKESLRTFRNMAKAFVFA